MAAQRQAVLPVAVRQAVGCTLWRAFTHSAHCSGDHLQSTGFNMQFNQKLMEGIQKPTDQLMAS